MKMSNEYTNPPEQAPTNRRQMLKYMERFGRWARKLDDTDLSMVVAFCANVQMAWSDGQKKTDDAAEAVQLGLPGISAPLEEKSDASN
jgi:hypothetical protein